MALASRSLPPWPPLIYANLPLQPGNTSQLNQESSLRGWPGTDWEQQQQQFCHHAAAQQVHGTLCFQQPPQTFRLCEASQSRPRKQQQHRPQPAARSAAREAVGVLGSTTTRCCRSIRWGKLQTGLLGAEPRQLHRLRCTPIEKTHNSNTMHQPGLSVLPTAHTFSTHLLLPPLSLQAEASAVPTEPSSSSNGSSSRPQVQLPKNFDPAAREQELYRW